MPRPTHETFIEWIKNGNNFSEIQRAINEYRDLVHIKDEVEISSSLFMTL